MKKITGQQVEEGIVKQSIVDGEKGGARGRAKGKWGWSRVSSEKWKRP